MSGRASQSYGGFSMLPVSYRSSQHIIYVRAQVGASKGKSAIAWPQDRTLFIVNLPPDATARELSLLFRSCGAIEKAVFDSDAEWGLGEDEGSSDAEDGDEQGGLSEGEDESDDENRRKKQKFAKEGEDSQPRPPKVVSLPNPSLRRLRRTGHTAHVVFLDASSCSRALALATPPISSSKTQIAAPRPWPTDIEAPTGFAHYVALYDSLRPPLDTVLAHAETSIGLFDHEQAEKKRALQHESKYRKGEAIVDEDGFTLVTRGGAYGKAVGGGVGIASKKFTLQQAKGTRAGIRDGSRKRKHTESKEDAFYAFQIHEKKRNALIDLKRKWEEDKAAVEKLKASRKFKPY
ncbi:ribosomal RNA-processing protein 7-domain-containing protein [Vararia minispora EC-137]|uniref:Ribosomal RNA-processing protein 7-domain-containing protein n=1 Tax=Vararia minispora EC-137 TaxID=1314806 RepID=A0ACB8QS22_9AGAM|nr:ribosomal RNA-processing protein 7-domain-containing protein [Vararia minispora EC-137]